MNKPEEITARELLQIRAWAECKADLEIELGFPAEQRLSRIEALIVERSTEPDEPTITPAVRNRIERYARQFADGMQGNVRGFLKTAELPATLYPEALAIVLEIVAAKGSK